MESKYDLIIVGAGPAGLSSGIYAGRYLLKTLILGEISGGTISEAHKVCNFPSYTEITGFELSNKMYNHAITNGSEISNEKVIEIKKINQNEFQVKTDRNTYLSKKVILANGRKKRLLNVKGEKEFLGKGVSYCATCDGGFYKDKVVAVVGGSNSAITAALLLSEYAQKVMIMYRKDNFFRAEPAWVKLAKKNSKIEFLFNTEIKEIIGKDSVEKVLLKNEKEIKLDGIFVEIGSIPDDTFEKQLKIETEKGYIVTNKKQETNIKGVFAAGDITNNSLKQAVTAASEGAIAATSAYEEIQKQDI